MSGDLSGGRDRVLAKRRLADDWRSRTASSESIFSEKRAIAASTEFGMHNLIEVERIDKENPTRLKHCTPPAEAALCRLRGGLRI